MSSSFGSEDNAGARQFSLNRIEINVLKVNQTINKFEDLDITRPVGADLTFPFLLYTHLCCIDLINLSLFQMEIAAICVIREVDME